MKNLADNIVHHVPFLLLVTACVILWYIPYRDYKKVKETYNNSYIYIQNNMDETTIKDTIIVNQPSDTLSVKFLNDSFTLNVNIQDSDIDRLGSYIKQDTSKVIVNIPETKRKFRLFR